jgi:hypothetical protein
MLDQCRFPDPLSKQRIEQFHLAHSQGSDENWFFSPRSQCVYYRDGARHHDYPMGAMVNPSNDPHEHRKQRIQFYTLKMQRAVEEFDQWRGRLMSCVTAVKAGKAFDLPTDEDYAKLKRLHDDTLLCKRHLAEVEEVPRSPEEIQRQKNLAKWQAETVEKANEIEKQLEAMQV